MDDRTVLAYHEAGHAVAHVRLGMPFYHVSIIANDEFDGHVRPNSGYLVILASDITSRKRGITALAHGTVITLWAGIAAEEILLGHDSTTGSYTDEADIQSIARRRSKRPKAWAQRLKRLTRQILEAPEAWNQVSIIADVLLEKQYLTDKEVFASLGLDYPQAWGTVNEHMEAWVKEKKAELQAMLDSEAKE